MIVEKFKEIAEALGLKFNYGDAHWQNLQDLRNGEQGYLLLLWKKRIKDFDEYNNILRRSYSGEFLLVRRSQLDDVDYNQKYAQHIKPLEKAADALLSAFSLCEGWTITQWDDEEVYNRLDTNLDGLKVSFKVEYEK